MRTITCANVPKAYCDAITLELMEEPVICKVSRKCYEAKTIRRYVEQFQREPETLQSVSLSDLKSNATLQAEIRKWKRANVLAGLKGGEHG